MKIRLSKFSSEFDEAGCISAKLTWALISHHSSYSNTFVATADEDGLNLIELNKVYEFDEFMDMYKKLLENE